MPRPSARDTILDTAEKLFSEQGLEAVSLRTINTEAGYSVAALHYHFGSREQLVDALLARCQPTILAKRERLVQALKDSPQPGVHALAESLVLPIAEPILQNPDSGRHTVGFLFRMYLEQREHARVGELTRSSLQMFNQLLQQALPGIDADTLQQRWQIATQLTFQSLSSIPLTEDNDKKAVQLYVSRLVDFIAGGLAAEDLG